MKKNIKKLLFLLLLLLLLFYSQSIMGYNPLVPKDLMDYFLAELIYAITAMIIVWYAAETAPVSRA